MDWPSPLLATHRTVTDGVTDNPSGSIGGGVWAIMVYRDFDRDTADDLDVVPGGILGREGGEPGAAAFLYALHTPPQLQLRVGIDPDLDRLGRGACPPVGFP